MGKVVWDASLKWVCEHWQSADSSLEGKPAFAFLEIPFDHAVSHRPGARYGPAGILSALDGYSLYCADKRVSLEETTFRRFGEVDVVHDIHATYANIRREVAAIPNDYVVVALGGDHSLSDPMIRGMQDRLGGRDLGLIVFDAHFDSRVPVPGREHSGHWMKTLEGALDYSRAVQLGINAPIYSQRYMDEAEGKGVLVRTPYEIRKRGWPQVVAAAVEHATQGTRGIYLSVDIDSFDQSCAPGTSVPNPHGFLAHEVLDAVFEIACQANTLGMDINEVSPPLDVQNFTSELAAQVVLNFIAGNVVRLERSHGIRKA